MTDNNNHPNLDPGKRAAGLLENQKNSWQNNLLEYLHNCFIGISHLACTEEECPLVEN
jgi:hypothetical protein